MTGQFKYSFNSWSRWNQNDSYSFSVTLFSSGDIEFDYAGLNSVPFNSNFDAGVSIGNDVGAANPAVSSDLNAGGDSGAIGWVYQDAWGPLDPGNSTITFVPNGAGGFGFAMTCSAILANHTSIGTGCYTSGSSYYEEFVFDPQAAGVLNGNGVAFALTVGGYDASWVAGGGASFVAPTGTETALILSDNGDAVITTPAVPVPGGMTTSWNVSANGILTIGALANNAGDSTPSGSDLTGAAAPAGGFYFWHDYNPPAGGVVSYEVTAMTLFVTFDAVESQVPGPATFQFQVDLATGNVLLAIVTAASSPMIFRTVVGCTLAGVGLDSGSSMLTGNLFSLGPDVQALGLSAAPTPISTGAAGTLVTYTVTDIPDAWVDMGVPSGIHFGGVIWSNSGGLPGLDLTSLGLPGCTLYVGGIDVIGSYVGGTPTNSVDLMIPAGVAVGMMIYAQAFALTYPGSLPNGQNTYGAVVSNGVASFINNM